MYLSALRLVLGGAQLGARIAGPGNTAKRTMCEALTEGRPQYPQAQCWLCGIGIPNCQDSSTVGSDPSGGDHWEHDRTWDCDRGGRGGGTEAAIGAAAEGADEEPREHLAGGGRRHAKGVMLQ